MDSTRLKEIAQSNATQALASKRHEDTLKSTHQVADTVIMTTGALINYLEGHTTKTEVVNHLQSIGTPDALEIIPHLQSLHETLKTHENTDLSEVTGVMKQILAEAQKLPKEAVHIPEQKVVDNTKQFESMTAAIKAVEKVVREQKLVVEAPIVNVPTPSVHVDAPDLEPITNAIKDVVKYTKDKTVKVDGPVETQQLNTLITEPFDEYRLIYDDFGDDNKIEAITYYYKSKKVATISYKYKNGRLAGCKRT